MATKKNNDELVTAEKKAVKKVTKKVAELVETETIAEVIVDETKKIEKTEKLAKAGKRSAKSLKETEEKIVKEEKKAAKEDAPVAPKVVVKTRTRVERKGKKFQEVAKLIDRNKEYSLKEAVELAQKTAKVSFDSTLELHIKLGVDPRQADQNLRANVVLPAGTGKTVKIAVFTDHDSVAAAKKAGADIAGSDDFLQQLDKGIIDFDVLIASPSVMPKLGKYARILGPKGLMPSPKSGTVTSDVAKAVSEAKAGRVEYRVDSTGIVHLGAGKVSFKTEDLVKNVRVVLDSIKTSKPASLKGNYVLSIYLSTSMGPSVRVSNTEL
jgi:large subunit ribosomal protein L1